MPSVRDLQRDCPLVDIMYRYAENKALRKREAGLAVAWGLSAHFAKTAQTASEKEQAFKFNESLLDYTYAKKRFWYDPTEAEKIMQKALSLLD